MADAPSIAGYDFVAPVAQGGFAQVFQYEQHAPRMRVAVKVLTTEATERARQQFLAEANAMALVSDHPNIVQVFKVDETGDGRPYIVMKFFPGENLGVRARREPFRVEDVLQIGIRIGSAVETAHRAGILHRDIKPANILTGSYGEPGLTDFGIASHAAAAPDADDALSLPWAAPEVVADTAPASRASDIYSLAATLWHLLAGRSPFELPHGDNGSQALARRVLDGARTPLERTDVPQSLQRLLVASMHREPSLRPPSALAFAQALQAVESEMFLERTRIEVREELGPLPSVTETLSLTHPATTQPSATQPLATQPSATQPTATQSSPTQPLDTQPHARTAPPPVLTGVPFALPTPAPLPATAPGPVPASMLPRQARERVLPGQHDEEATRLRQGPVPSAPVDPATKRPTALITGVGAFALVAAVVLAVVLLGNRGVTKDPIGPLPSSSATQAAAVPLTAAPGRPTVTGMPVGTDAVFTFTYTGALVGDAFRWRNTETPDVVNATPAETFRTPLTGQQVCVQVQVVRADGSSGSPFSSPVCVG